MSKSELSDLLARFPGATVSKPVDVEELLARADVAKLARGEWATPLLEAVPADPYASETERQFAAWLERQPPIGPDCRWSYWADKWPLELPAGLKYTPDFVCASVSANWQFERVFVEVKWRENGTAVSKAAAGRSRIMLKLAAWKFGGQDFYFVRPKGKSFVEWVWSYAEVQEDGSVSFRRNVSPWTPRPLEAIRKKRTAAPVQPSEE